MSEFWLCFVPLFVAVDALGVMPMYLALTDGIPRARRPAVLGQSVATAAVVGALFLVLGRSLLALLGITVADFMIAGGLLLLVISISDILTGQKRQRAVDADSVGAVPIGVPLITGPAVLTTSILLANQHGLPLTLLAFVLNILIAGAILACSEPITRALGQAGTRTLSKIASLLLAAIAVMLVRKGVMSFLP